MSDLEGLSARLDHLAEAIDVALTRRDLPAYRTARAAYGAALDQLEARIEAARREDEALGLADLRLFLVELPPT